VDNSGTVRVSTGLVRLGTWVLLGMAALAAGIALVGLITKQSDPFLADVPFTGWQTNAADGVLAALVLAGLILSARGERRWWRLLRDRTQHRRAVVLAAVLPGLFGGSLLAQPMHDAIDWSARHTAAAAKAQAHYRTLLVDYRKRPPKLPFSDAPATPALADRMLRAADLGVSWYLDAGNGPTRFRVLRPDLAARDGARTVLSQQHWQGGQWQLDALVLEAQFEFGSPAAATNYVTQRHANPREAAQYGPPSSSVSRSSLDGVRVWIRQSVLNPGSRSAAFVFGDTSFTVVASGSTGHVMTRHEFDHIVRIAIRRARVAG